MKTFHIFGDTGAHMDSLVNGLENIGMDMNTYQLPDNVSVIHCGDLIHKGPNTNEIVAFVNTVMQVNGNKWVQLAGNHELNYLGGPQFWLDKTITMETFETLNRWWNEGRMVIAASLPSGVTMHNLVVSKRGLETPDKPTLITHAGVTKSFFKALQPGGKTVDELVEQINSLPVSVVSMPGRMLLGNKRTGYPVGPVWASAVDEVWKSWAAYDFSKYEEDELPFNQIFGHTYPYDFSRKVWWAGTFGMFKKYSRVNEDRRTVVTNIGDAIFVAVDPGYEKVSGNTAQPALKVTI